MYRLARPPFPPPKTGRDRYLFSSKPLRWAPPHNRGLAKLKLHPPPYAPSAVRTCNLFGNRLDVRLAHSFALLNVCMYVCMCVCVCVYVYIYMYTYTYNIHTYIYTCMHTHAHTHSSAKLCAKRTSNRFPKRLHVTLGAEIVVDASNR